MKRFIFMIICLINIKMYFKKSLTISLILILLTSCGLYKKLIRDRCLMELLQKLENVEEGKGVTMGGILNRGKLIMNLVLQILFGELH